MTENENISTPDLSPMAQDLIQNEAPDNALVALLNELEETAAELRTELEARHGLRQQSAAEAHETDATDAATEVAAAPKTAERHAKKNPNVTPEQEAELNENFEEYWTNSQGSWKNLFRLLREFRTEMKENKQHG